MALQGCLSFHWAHDNVWGYSEGIFAWRAFWSLPVGTLEVSFILYSSQYIWECSGQLGQELKRNYNLLGFIPSLLLHLYCFERCGMHKNTIRDDCLWTNYFAQDTEALSEKPGLLADLWNLHRNVQSLLIGKELCGAQGLCWHHSAANSTFETVEVWEHISVLSCGFNTIFKDTQPLKQVWRAQVLFFFTFWWIPPLCFKNFLVWTLQLFLLCNPCSAIHAVQAWRNLEFYCLIILGLLRCLLACRKMFT